MAGESKSGLSIKDGAGPDRFISAGDIKQKKYAASSMPDMKALLSKKEIRDVVSFLAGLKEDS